MLAPSLEGLPPRVRSIALQARDCYPEFLAELHERADVDVALDRSGILQIAGTAAELEALARAAQAPVDVLDDRALAALEPAFEGHAGALLHPHDGAVDNVALMRALDLAVSREPRIMRASEAVVSLDLSSTRPSVTTSTGATYASATVLLASGAWATGLSGLPRRVPVHPIRGQLLTLDRLPIRHVTYGAGGYLVPRGGMLLIGATSEDTGFSNHTTDAGLATLRAIAERAVPGLATAAVVDHWAGLRPVTPDALPILGRDLASPALVYACGFSRNGILLAPWAAARLADLIATERLDDSLSLFSVERFDKSNLTG
jgi:thiazole synthase